jgi:hypothetical protein
MHMCTQSKLFSESWKTDMKVEYQINELQLDFLKKVFSHGTHATSSLFQGLRPRFTSLPGLRCRHDFANLHGA